MIGFLIQKGIAAAFLIACLVVLVWFGYDVALYVHDEIKRTDYEEDYYDDDYYDDDRR